jgi:hypothetical protein
MVTMRIYGEYNEIQICPWYLRKARGFKVTDLVSMDQPFYTSLSRVVMPFAAKFLYTPVDTFVLMDKTIVHELTHTFQALLSLRGRNVDHCCTGRVSYCSRRLFHQASDNTQSQDMKIRESISVFEGMIAVVQGSWVPILWYEF